MFDEKKREVDFFHLLDFESCECVIFSKQIQNKTKQNQGSLTKSFQTFKDTHSELEIVIFIIKEMTGISGERWPQAT